MNLWAAQQAHTDAVGTDGCKTSGSVIPQSAIRTPHSATSGSQPQTCAACNQPTVDPRPVCWVCVEQAKNMPAQMDDSAAATQDTARMKKLNADRVFIATLLISSPAHLSAAEIIDAAPVRGRAV